MSPKLTEKQEAFAAALARVDEARPETLTTVMPELLAASRAVVDEVEWPSDFEATLADLSAGIPILPGIIVAPSAISAETLREAAAIHGEAIDIANAAKRGKIVGAAAAIIGAVASAISTGGSSGVVLAVLALLPKLRELLIDSK